MDIDFQYIINMYQGNLCNLVMRKERGLITEEEYKAEMCMNRLWFGDMAYWLRKYEIRKGDQITQEEREEYEQLGKMDSGYVMDLIYIIDYRGHKIPVFCDDYGQQDICWFDGEWWGGGAYNFNPEDDFCSFADSHIENELIRSFKEEENDD